MCSIVTVTVEHTDSGGGILSGGIISSNSLGHNSWLKQFSSRFHAVRRRSSQRVVLKSCGLKQFSILGSSCGRTSQCVAVEPGEPGPRKLGDPGRRGSRIRTTGSSGLMGFVVSSVQCRWRHAGRRRRTKHGSSPPTKDPDHHARMRTAPTGWPGTINAPRIFWLAWHRVASSSASSTPSGTQSQQPPK